MQRIRRAGSTALAFVLAMGLSGSPATGSPWFAGVATAASVAWPTSTLVVSEVQTGGASASDEFVEVANQGSAPVDLIGLEVVYATSSGSTVTRKATWAESFVLEPGRRVLIVNGAGALAGVGDAVFTQGAMVWHQGIGSAGSAAARARTSSRKVSGSADAVTAECLGLGGV
ncbi:MAG: lamin tail domain-containing protein, partial [Candidatus Limnocylindrales bacterium]